MFHKNRQSKKTVFFLIALLLVMACNTSRLIPPTQSTGTSSPPFSPEQISSAVAMTITAVAFQGQNLTATVQPTNGAPLSGLVSFVPGNPTATPLGSEITDPNFLAGLIAFKAKDYKQAVTLMSAVIESNPNLAPPYRYRATSYWYVGNCPAGLIDADKALSINPDYAEAWAARGLLYSCLGDDAQALQDYEKALSIDPSLAFIHHNLGVYYYGLGDYQRSLDEYSLAVAIDPTRSGAWSGKSEALAKLGKFGECIENATKALEVSAEEWLAYMDRAECYMSMENYAAAAADYRAYLAQDTNNPAAWNNYGISQHKTSDFQGAVDSYTKALELNPSFYYAYINRGNSYVGLKQYQKALDDFNAALRFGDVPAAYSGRGDAYYGLEKYDRAVADYEMSLSMYPGSAHTHCFLALSYFELGRYQDVLDEAQASYDINPACGGAKLFEVQARSYYALKDYDQALVYINKALGLEPYSLGYYYRGIIYQAAGRNQEAISDLEAFVSFATASGTVPEELADAQARLKQLKP